MTVCQVCGSRADAFLCRRCTGDLEKAIAELPADLRDLELVAARQATGPLGLGVGRQWDEPPADGALGDAPWEFAPGAADQVWALKNTVTTWVRHLCESRGIEVPGRDEPLTGWLLKHIDAIRYDEAAGQIHDEIVGLHAENDRWIVGRSGTEVFAGRCDAAEVSFELGADGTLIPTAATCNAPLYGHDGEDDLRCTACGMKYRLAERLEARDRQIDDQLARAHQIAAALTSDDMPLSPERLRKWIERDKLVDAAPEGPVCANQACRHSTCRAIRRAPIHERARDEDGHALYRFGDVRARLRLLEEQRVIRLGA